MKINVDGNAQYTTSKKKIIFLIIHYVSMKPNVYIT